MSLFSSVVLADAKQECSEAYTRTQVLRDADKLEEGIKVAEVCARDACPKFIRDDCTMWKTELESRIASIIVEAVDATGAPLTDGAVLLDGVPWLDRIDGSAHVLAKGPHTLEITVKGATPLKKSIVVREGEKARKITLSTAPPPPPPPAEWQTIVPWVVGGAGVAALLAGAVTGALVVDAYSVVQDECNDETQTCSQEGQDASAQGRLLGPVTTGLLVGGGALAAAGVLWLVVLNTGAKSPKTAWFLVPIVSTDRSGLVLGGAW